MAYHLAPRTVSGSQETLSSVNQLSYCLLPFSLLSSTFSQLLDYSHQLKSMLLFSLINTSFHFFYFFCFLYSRSLKSCLSFLPPVLFLLISFTPSPVGFLSSTPLNLVSCSGTEPNGQFASLLQHSCFLFETLSFPGFHLSFPRFLLPIWQLLLPGLFRVEGPRLSPELCSPPP